MTTSSVNAPDPVAVYELARDEMRRARRGKEIVFLVLFAAVFAFSVIVGEVSVATLWEGLPGFFNYIADTIPVIHSDNVAGGGREWLWAWRLCTS